MRLPSHCLAPGRSPLSWTAKRSGITSAKTYFLRRSSSLFRRKRYGLSALSENGVGPSKGLQIAPLRWIMAKLTPSTAITIRPFTLDVIPQPIPPGRLHRPITAAGYEGQTDIRSRAGTLYVARAAPRRSKTRRRSRFLIYPSPANTNHRSPNKCCRCPHRSVFGAHQPPLPNRHRK